MYFHLMQVSFSIFLTNSGTGTTSTTTFPKASSCTCTSGGCNLNGYSYIASLPILAGVVATKTYATSCQSGTVPYSYTISSGTDCIPVTCSLLSDGTYQTITCSDSNPHKITTGYVQISNYNPTDTSCSRLAQAVLTPIWSCLVYSSQSSGYWYADTNGYTYQITFPNNACR